MNNRISTILASEAATVAATKTIDLNENAPLSKIVIRFKGTNSSATPPHHPAKMVSNIEVVDGSDVLYSMSGVQCQAMNFLETSELPFNCCEYENDIKCCATYDLNFGRFPWDRDFALDLRTFKNPQLKITHNKALGGSAPDAGTMSVYGYTFDDPQPSPSNFLMTKELYSYTMAAAANHYITLPRDYPYRVLMPQSYEKAKSFTDMFGAFEWYADNKRRVFIDSITGPEWAKIQPRLDLVEEDLAGLGNAASEEYWVAATYEGWGQTGGRSAVDATNFIGQPAGCQYQVTCAAATSFAASTNGYYAFGGTNLCMHEMNDPKAWFDPTEYGDVELRILGGGGAGTNTVCLSQNRPNGSH